MLLHKVMFTLSLGLLTVLPTMSQESKSLHMNLVSVKARSAKPLFQVELHNVSEQPLILSLGMMLSNGRKQYADAVHLSLTDDHGKVLALELKVAGIVAGRIDPLVVPLPPGATFTLPIDLADYISPKANVWELYLVAGRYTLSADYSGVGVPQQQANLDMKGISLMPYWTGSVKSNVVEFIVPRQVGVQQ